MLDGIIGFKSSYGAIKTDDNIILLPNVHYTKNASLTTDFKNLRSQCVFMLADKVNNHKIASKVTGEMKEKIIEELAVYQDASTGDGKRMATQKEDVKALIGRSPDHSDTWIMRMYFEIVNKMTVQESPERKNMLAAQRDRMAENRNRSVQSTR